MGVPYSQCVCAPRRLDSPPFHDRPRTPLASCLDPHGITPLASLSLFRAFLSLSLETRLCFTNADFHSFYCVIGAIPECVLHIYLGGDSAFSGHNVTNSTKKMSIFNFGASLVPHALSCCLSRDSGYAAVEQNSKLAFSHFFSHFCVSKESGLFCLRDFSIRPSISLPFIFSISHSQRVPPPLPLFSLRLSNRLLSSFLTCLLAAERPTRGARARETERERGQRQRKHRGSHPRACPFDL